MNGSSVSPMPSPYGTRVTLTDFLLARIAEDEACTQGLGAGWQTRLAVEEDAYRARLIQEIAAKRQIIARLTAIAAHEPNDKWNAADDALYDVLHIMAVPYADHPDCRDEWKQ